VEAKPGPLRVPAREHGTEGALDLAFVPRRAYVVPARKGVFQQAGRPSAYIRHAAGVSVRRRVGSCDAAPHEGGAGSPPSGATSRPKRSRCTGIGSLRLDRRPRPVLYRFLDLAPRPLREAYPGTLAAGPAPCRTSIVHGSTSVGSSAPALARTYPLRLAAAGSRRALPRLTLKTIAPISSFDRRCRHYLGGLQAADRSRPPGLCTSRIPKTSSAGAPGRRDRNVLKKL